MFIELCFLIFAIASINGYLILYLCNNLQTGFFPLFFLQVSLGSLLQQFCFLSIRLILFPPGYWLLSWLLFPCSLLNYALMTTAFYLRYPHYWRVLGWASFSFAPFAYLYVRSVLQQSYQISSVRFHFLYTGNFTCPEPVPVLYFAGFRKS